MNETLTKLSLVNFTKNSAILNNKVTVELLLTDNKIRLIYNLENPGNNLLIPPQSSPARRDNLWQHTCCEVFIGLLHQPQYLEFNFSPSGEWAAYAFSDYREPDDWPDPEPPEIRTTQTLSGLQLEAVILPDTLPEAFRNQPLELGISTVLEDKEQHLAYLALAHSQATPDFHRRDQWIKWIRLQP